MKFAFFTLCLLSFLTTNSQIISLDNSNEVKNQNENSILIRTSFDQCFRNVAINPYYNNSTIDNLVQERPLNLISSEINVNCTINRFFSYSFGIGYFQNGESNSFISNVNDSTNIYKNHFQYLGLPIKILWNPLSIPKNNHKLKINFNLGIIPSLLFSYKQKNQWTTSYGAQGASLLKVRDEINSYNLEVVSEIDFSYFFIENTAIHIIGTYRNSLTNSFNQYGSYKRNPYSYGIGIGISKTFG